MTPEEAAKILRLTTDDVLTTYDVLELCRSGELKATPPVTAGPWLILSADLDAYLVERGAA